MSTTTIAPEIAALACGCRLVADDHGRVMLHSCGAPAHTDAPTNWRVVHVGEVTTLERVA